MEGDEIRIERPTIPLELQNIFKKINKILKDINDKFKKIKNESVRNGVYAGVFLSMFIFFFSFNIFFFSFNTIFNIIIAFIVGFIATSIITEIVKFIIKTTSYTPSQRFGISLGFLLLLVFCAIIVIIIDTQIGNPVYSISNMLNYAIRLLIKFLTTDAIRFTKSSFNSMKDVLYRVAEVLKLKEADDRKIFFGCLMKYLGVILVIVFTCLLIFRTSYDATAVNVNTIPYVIFIAIPLLMSIFLFSPSVSIDDMPTLLILFGGFIFMIIILYIYYSTSLNPTTLYYSSYTMNILLFIILIVGFCILFNVFSGELKKLTGWPGFFINLFFFLPCLLNDGLQYLFNQFKITPNIVILLLFLEIGLVLLYVYIPVLIDKIAKKDTSSLLNRPIFIDREIPIGDSSLFLLNPIDDNSVYKTDQLYRKNYAFSMWIYLNQHSSSNSAYVNGAKIFDFGGGKPSIFYKNQSDNTRIPNKDMYIITFSNTSTDTKYEIHLQNQKWNNFVFNYLDSKVDLYINGSLEQSFELANNLPEYLPTDVITVGDKNGLQGAICNVNFYNNPMTPEKIMLLYNLLSVKNPPLNL